MKLGWCTAFTPPHSAISHSPARSPCTARCSALSDDEQALSTQTLGPRQPRKYDTRPAIAKIGLPAARCPSSSS